MTIGPLQSRQNESIKQMDRAELLTLFDTIQSCLQHQYLSVGDKAYKYGTSYHLINEYLEEGVKSVSDAVNPEEKKS